MTVGVALALSYLAVGLLRLSVIIYFVPKVRRLKDVDDFNQQAWRLLGDQIGPWLLLELLIWPIGIAIGLDLWLKAREEHRKKVVFLEGQVKERLGEPVPGYADLEAEGSRDAFSVNPPDPGAAPSVFDSLNFHPDDEIVRPIGCICLSCRKLRGEV